MPRARPTKILKTAEAMFTPPEKEAPVPPAAMIHPIPKPTAKRVKKTTAPEVSVDVAKLLASVPKPGEKESCVHCGRKAPRKRTPPSQMAAAKQAVDSQATNPLTE